MIDLDFAINAFKDYVDQYDLDDSSIHLKYVHTFEVMKINDYLCDQLNLTKQEKALSGLIALLHDIGRFEQWKQYHSFADYKTVDHALFSSDLLFNKGLIRSFIKDDKYDFIIKSAIEQHNKYKVEDGFDDETLMYIHLIRDADKLDNFRVKEDEPIENILFVSSDDVNNSLISSKIYNDIYHYQLIYVKDRKTHLDMWLSYIAFIFDLYFKESKIYIRDNKWVERSFDRFMPTHKETRKQYLVLKERTLHYIHEESLWDIRKQRK